MALTPSPAAATPPEPVERSETPPTGLTRTEVDDRVARGLTNASGVRTSRTLTQIVRANVFTRFNAILGTMLVLILVFGSPADGLFGFVLIGNALIGIVQEYRAKRTLDRLAVLSAPMGRVVRDGAVIEVPVDDIVLDDLLELRSGDQVPADGRVHTSDGLELDESLLTGESEPIAKHPGDPVLSGAIVIAGTGRCQATAVGEDAYARKLAAEARRFTVTHSELVTGINEILKLVTWILLVVGPLLFLRGLQHQGVSAAVTGAVAGVVLMVPEGLVLLTSISFGLAAVVLARRRVLVQELPAVEGLARVDVVCLDKTGTLTEGIVEFDRLEVLDPAMDQGELAAALGAMSNDEGGNATQDAIANAFPAPEAWSRDAVVAFSSARKWSAASYGDHGVWVLGAPEMVWLDGTHAVRRQADELAATGNRVLLLARGDALAGEQLPSALRPVALVLLKEKVRADAAETLDYFRQQGVALKVISGDNPRTVGAVARRVGLPDVGEPVDARELPEDLEELAAVLDGNTVFGRVTPQQKRAMVKALQSRGHVVAMTGDGVNDALALKDADIGVAMGSGAAATRAVAQLVLLDSEFSTLPGVVAEGRRVIANIERVSNLFLTKTTYAALLAIVTVFVGWPYPFLPRQSTIVNGLTIGIPAFFLALAPNTQRYLPGFLRRVMRFAIPAGVIVGTAVVVIYAIARTEGVGTRDARTTATVVLMVLGLYVLSLLARPFTRYRLVLLLAMIGAFLGALVIPPIRDFFKLSLPDADIVATGLAIAVVGCVALEIVTRTVRRRMVAPDAGATTSPAS
ncbi:MAG TPA: HAD-IC family P-type ATPase [Acidimicrobiia bacterium]